MHLCNVFASFICLLYVFVFFFPSDCNLCFVFSPRPASSIWVHLIWLSLLLLLSCLHQVIFKIHNALSCVSCINNVYIHIWTKKLIFKGSIHVPHFLPSCHIVVDSWLNNTAHTGNAKSQHHVATGARNLIKEVTCWGSEHFPGIIPLIWSHNYIVAYCFWLSHSRPKLECHGERVGIGRTVCSIILSCLYNYIITVFLLESSS